jgi:ligand-binding SRPBCC domain-containing protein
MGFRLETVQILRQPIDRIFEFFADAFQLETLTPRWLRFIVLTPAPIVIRAGTLIDYRLRLHGIPVRWQSRISVWEPPFRFVDEQVRGPYRRWHHEHVFESTEQGTRCRDIVDYEVPGGRLIDNWLVRPDLLKIFAYRQQRLRELFPEMGQASTKSVGPLRCHP